MADQPTTFFQIEIPDDVTASFGDFVNIWHTPDVFVLDVLGIKAPPFPGTSPEGVEGTVVPARVLHRVKLPPSQVFEVMKALEAQLSSWEVEHGRRPGGPAEA